MERFVIQVRRTQDGITFVLLDPNGNVAAISRTFRNERWLQIGLRLLSYYAVDAPLVGSGIDVSGMGAHYAVMRLENDRRRFILMTEFGKELLRSREYDTRLEMEREIQALRDMAQGWLDKGEMQYRYVGAIE